MVKIKLNDFKTFLGRAKHMYHLRSEANESVTYTPNASQQYIEQARNEEFARSMREDGVKRCKFILLKSRQIGGTTDTAMFNGDIMLQLNLARGLVLAHDDISTSIIYQKYKHWYNSLPDRVQLINDDGSDIIVDGNPLVVPVKPETISNSGFRLQFEKKEPWTGSDLIIRTAGSGDNVGKGDTLNYFHGCLHKDSEIILSSGKSVKIEDIDIGDTVITSSGITAPVTNKWYTGQKDTVKIHTWLAEPLAVTREHKVLTERGYVQAGKLTKNDWIQQSYYYKSNDKNSKFFKQINNSWFAKIVKIEEFENSDVYDIEVGHDDHNYETSIGIVSNSEAANWQHFNDVLHSVTQSIPRRSPFTYMILESTANGISGKGEGFYKLWSKSVEEWDRFKTGKSDSFEGFRPIFVPWYELDKYRIPPKSGKLIDIDLINFHSPEAKQSFLDKEDWLVNEVFDNEADGLAAINWYRWCIKENCGYDINEANRYYPTVPEDAFLASDNSFFDSNKLFVVKEDYMNKGEPDHELGYLNEDFEFIKDSSGNLKIWHHPDGEYWNRFIVSADPAYGVEGGDYSCVMVFDRLEDRFCAKWYGNVKEDELADIVLRIAYYYNEALIIPEMNLRTLTTLIAPGGIMEYTGPIYERYVKNRGSMDYGYNTLSSNKLELLNNYAAWLRNNYYNLKDLELIDEHITFIKKITKGLPKLEAAEGKHDDQVISAALAIEAANWWEDEIVELTSDKNDIRKIIDKPKVTTGFRASSKGGNLRGSQSFKQSRLK